MTREEIVGALLTGEPTTVVGGRTFSHCGDGRPAPRILRMDASSQILAHEPADLVVTCEAGVTLGALNARLAASGQHLPVFHPEPGRATLGGLVASGWTGFGRRLYGPLRDRVLEVVVVTGDGRLVRGGAKVVKNVTGFDLPRLFCGSMGTLGVIVELTLKVDPLPGDRSAVFADFDDQKAAIDWGLAGYRSAPGSLEIIVDGSGDKWRTWAVCHGPQSDVNLLLAGFVGGQSAADPLPRFGSDAKLSASEGTVVRVSVPPSMLGDGQVEIPDGSLLDLCSGTFWASVEADWIRSARESAESIGGSLVILAARTEVRTSLTTWGSAGPAVDIMRRLKSEFDPGGVLEPGRFAFLEAPV